MGVAHVNTLAWAQAGCYRMCRYEQDVLRVQDVLTPAQRHFIAWCYGIVNVSAKDLGTGKQQQITITSSSNMKEEEINEAIKNAEKYAKEDKERREVIEQRNQADAMILGLEKALRENGDKISEDDKKKLNDAIAKAKEEIKADDKDKIMKAVEDLSKSSQDVITKLYQASAEAAKSTENKDEPDVEVKDADAKKADDESKK